MPQKITKKQLKNNMKDIIESYKRFIEDKTEDEIYDTTIDFISGLTRSEAVKLMEYLLKWEGLGYELTTKE